VEPVAGGTWATGREIKAVLRIDIEAQSLGVLQIPAVEPLEVPEIE
jgi:hypothetical protein